jgi:5-methylcytosine-specific restriction endonuclease McrA
MFRSKGRGQKQIAGDILRNHRREAWEEQQRCCKYCLEPLPFHASTAEHRVPKSKGGTNARANIDAACQPCNKAKGSSPAAWFAKAIRNPPVGASFAVLMAWSRRRIWLAIHRASRNIAYAVGLPNPSPVGRRDAA